MDNTNTKPFSLADGLSIQQRDIAEWQHVLKPHVWEGLKNKAAEENDSIKEEWGNTGYDVWRGQDITNWIISTKERLSRK